MSHFTVLVPANSDDDLERALAPYHEYETTGDTAHTQWVISIHAEDIEEHLEEILEQAKGKDWEKEYQENYEKGDYEKILRDWEGGAFDSDGNWGCITNPNAKWDWWSVGGRWTGLLKLKEERKGDAWNGTPGVFGRVNTDPDCADSALAGDVDWEGMRKADFDREMERYDLFQEALARVSAETYPLDDKTTTRMEEEYLQDDTRGGNIRKVWPTLGAYIQSEMAKQYLRKEKDVHFPWAMTFNEWGNYYLPREEFAKLFEVQSLTWAFIDLDGKWIEPAEMGWWGMHPDKDESFNATYWKFIESLSENQRVYVVDCHI